MPIFNYDNYNMYNPEGNVMQLKYSKKTSDLGNTALSLKNKDTGIMIAYNPLDKLKEVSSKIYKINENILFTFSGITNDGLLLLKYLKDKILIENVLKDRKIHPIYVFKEIIEEISFSSLIYNQRLNGIKGILMMKYENEIKIIEYDQYEVREKIGTAIGNRNQSCKTILEIEEYQNKNKEELIKIGVKAMKNAFSDKEGKKIVPEEIEIFEIGEKIRKIESSKYI